MTEFRQQDKLQDITSYDPGIVSPVQDNTVAQGIASVAETGIGLYKKGQQVRGQQLGKEMTDTLAQEVGGADLAFEQGALQAKNTAKERGYQIARGKSSLTPVQFQARAEVELRKMMAENPFFSDEIAAGFASVTGYDPRGATNRALFEAMKAQGKGDSKALDFYYDMSKTLKVPLMPDGSPDIPRVIKVMERKRVIDNAEDVLAQNKNNGEAQLTLLAKRDGTFDALLPAINGKLINEFGIDLNQPGSLEAIQSLSGTEVKRLQQIVEESYNSHLRKLQQTYNYAFSSHTEKFNDILRPLEAEKNTLLSAIENKSILSWVDNRNQIADAEIMNDLRDRDPAAYATFVQLREFGLTQGISLDLKQILQARKLTDIFVSSGQSTGLPNQSYAAAPKEGRKAVTDVMKKIYSGIKSETNIKDPDSIIVPTLNMLDGALIEMDKENPDSQSIMYVLDAVSSPGFSNLMNSNAVDQEQKMAIIEKSRRLASEYIPSIAMDVSSIVAKQPGASLDVDNSGFFYVKDGKSVPAVAKLNKLVKSLAHLQGESGISAYKKQSTYLNGYLQPKTEQSQAEEQVPVAKKAQEYAKAIEELSKLSNEVQRPEVIRKTRLLQERVDKLNKEIIDMTGGSKEEPKAPEVSLTPEQERELRIALAMQEYPGVPRETIESIV